MKRIIGTLFVMLIAMFSFGNAQAANTVDDIAEEVETEAVVETTATTESTEPTEAEVAAETTEELESILDSLDMGLGAEAETTAVTPEEDLSALFESEDVMEIDTMEDNPMEDDIYADDSFNTIDEEIVVDDSFFNELENTLMSGEVVLDTDDSLLIEPETDNTTTTIIDDNTVDTTYVSGGKGMGSGKYLTPTGLSETLLALAGLLATGGIFAYRRKKDSK